MGFYGGGENGARGDLQRGTAPATSQTRADDSSGCDPVATRHTRAPVPLVVLEGYSMRAPPKLGARMPSS